MARKWSEIVKTDAYQELGGDEKYKAREEYFNDVLAPQVGDDEREALRQEFYADTDDASFGMGDKVDHFVRNQARGILNSATFGFGDNIVAGARAVTEDDTDYDTALDQERAANAKARDELGNWAYAGDAVGALATGSALAKMGATLMGGKMFEGAGMLGKMGLGAAEGAAYGAVNGVGNADAGFDVGQNATAAALGAAGGGALGAAAVPVASLLTGTMRKLFGSGSGMVNDARVAVDGTKLDTRMQGLFTDAAGGDNAARVMNGFDDAGADAMFVNASPDAKGYGMGLVAKGGEGANMLEDALVAQQMPDARLGRLLQGADDALGKTGRDRALIEEGSKEARQLINAKYDGVLKGVTVDKTTRQTIADAARAQMSKLGSNNRIYTALQKYADVNKLPANGLVLKHMKEDIKFAKASYKGSEHFFEHVSRSIDDALDSATGGVYKRELTGPLSKLHQDSEAVETAAGFITPSKGPTPREITAHLTADPGRAKLMREVGRDAVDTTIRGSDNAVTSLDKLLGKGADSLNRQRAGALFGKDNADKLASTVTAEVGKARDYGQIVSGSMTARRTAAAEMLNANGFAVPDAHSVSGIAAGLVSSALKKIKGLTGSQQAQQVAMAKVLKMDKAQLQEFIKQLDRAARAKAQAGAVQRSLVPMAGVVGGAGLQGR